MQPQEMAPEKSPSYLQSSSALNGFWGPLYDVKKQQNSSIYKDKGRGGGGMHEFNWKKNSIRMS